MLNNISIATGACFGGSEWHYQRRDVRPEPRARRRRHACVHQRHVHHVLRPGAYCVCRHGRRTVRARSSAPECIPADNLLVLFRSRLLGNFGVGHNSAQTDLRTLADLAHFLMGSSATLALQRVAAVCQRMESIGEASLAADSDSKAGGADGAAGATEDALKQIAELLKEGKREYADAERWLKSWYAQHNQTFESTADAAPDPEGEGDADPKPDAEAAAPLAGSIEKSPAAGKAAGIDRDAPPPRPPPTEAATPNPAPDPKLKRQSDKPIAV